MAAASVCSSSALHAQHPLAWPARAVAFGVQLRRGASRRHRQHVASSSPTAPELQQGPLHNRRCSPCHSEGDDGSLMFMGFCQTLDRRTAEQYLQQLDGWCLEDDSAGALHLTRTWLAKNFRKALVLAERIAAVAEQEGHHPDIHLQGWNRLKVDLWTHGRRGLTENDVILAAKLDRISKEGLLRPLKERLADV